MVNAGEIYHTWIDMMYLPTRALELASFVYKIDLTECLSREGQNRQAEMLS